MYHDGILKAFLCHNVSCLDSLSDKLHQLHARIIGSLPKLRRRCRHQSGSRQHQAECLRHNLHGRSRSHKRARAAAGAGIVLVIVQLAVRNHTGLLPGVKLADLLQRQQLIDCAGRIIYHIFLRQSVCLHDTARHHNGTHLLQTADAHQHRRHRLVAACDEHAAVIHTGICLCLHEVHDCIAVCQRVIDSVMALCNAVTHIRGKISCCLSAVLIDGLDCLFRELIQMRASRMAVAIGALHHNLRLCKVFHLPAHSHLQRIIFRCQCSYCLRTKFHAVTSCLLSSDILCLYCILLLFARKLSQTPQLRVYPYFIKASIKFPFSDHFSSDFCDILLQYRIIISFVCLYEIMRCFIQSLKYHEK